MGITFTAEDMLDRRAMGAEGEADMGAEEGPGRMPVWERMASSSWTRDLSSSNSALVTYFSLATQRQRERFDQRARLMRRGRAGSDLHGLDDVPLALALLAAPRARTAGLRSGGGRRKRPA